MPAEPINSSSAAPRRAAGLSRRTVGASRRVWALGLVALVVALALVLLVTLWPKGGPSTAPPPVATTTPTPTPSPSSPSTTPSPTAPPPVPTGISGDWSLAFADEFDGTSLGSVWQPYCQQMNNVWTDPENATVADGVLSLRLSGDAGVTLMSASVDGCDHGPDSYRLPVGGVVEFRAKFPLDGHCVNWPAVWTSGPHWPEAGEHDVAEVLGQNLTTNYHYSDEGEHKQVQPDPPSGSWCGSWHTYAVERGAEHATYYWDGKKVGQTAMRDNGDGQALILTMGQEGATSDKPLQVDYVRAWE